MRFLSDDHLTKIKHKIQEELLKRGFHAEIIKLEENTNKNRNEHYIVLESEYFQTTPVLFKSIRIENFSTSVMLGKERDNTAGCTTVWVGVHARYNNFSGGSNGVKLFDFKCLAWNDGYSDEISEIKIY